VLLDWRERQERQRRLNRPARRFRAKLRAAEAALTELGAEITSGNSRVAAGPESGGRGAADQSGGPPRAS